MIDFPGVMPHGFEWGPAAAVLKSPSLANNSEVVIGRAGPRWGAVLRYTVLNPRNACLIDAWLAEQNGGAEKTWMGPLQQHRPAGTLRGAPLVHGAGQLGIYKTLRNCDPGRTLLVGDHIQIGIQVYKILADTFANESGLMTLKHWPPTRIAHADGELVRWNKPACPMRLVESRYAMRYGSPMKPGYSGPLEIALMESWL